VIVTKTEFLIEKMDCPSEENLIRMKLDEFKEIKHIDFDIQKRTIAVFHTGSLAEIEESILDLKLGGKIIGSEEVEIQDFDEHDNQRKLLWSVLIINFSFFALEIIFGLYSRSMGLVADSLDMLADSFVYAISIFAVGGTVLLKKRISKIAGYFQITLALIGFVEVIRRFVGVEEMPQFLTMIVISVFALIANSACLFILQKSKSKEAHMQASMIFTSNDVIINVGVIIAGTLVFFLNSNMPDLIVGAIVFLLVIQGAIRILKLSK
jgi:Co/Zn/Cd efflux system component